MVNSWNHNYNSWSYSCRGISCDTKNWWNDGIYKRNLWRKIRFLTGWMQIVLFYPGMMAALGVIFGEQASALIGSPSLLLPIAIGIIIIVAGLNMLGSKLEESYKLFLQFVS